MNGACWDTERKDRERKGDTLGMLKIVNGAIKVVNREKDERDQKKTGKV